MSRFLATRLSPEAIRSLSLTSLDSICYPSESPADPDPETGGRRKRVGHKLTLGSDKHGQRWLGGFFSGSRERATHSLRVILTRLEPGSQSGAEVEDEGESFELYQGHTTVAEATAAFEAVRAALGPLLETGMIPASEHLLSELLLPSPKPLQELPAILLKVDGDNYHTYVNEKFDQKTLLHLACEMGDHESVKKLLESGASIEATHQHMGHTPLHIAALAKGALESLKHVLAHATRLLPEALRSKFLHRHDKSGYTALHLACLNDNADAVDSLVKAGAKLATPTIGSNNSNPCISLLSITATNAYRPLTGNTNTSTPEEKTRQCLLTEIAALTASTRTETRRCCLQSGKITSRVH